MSRKIYKSLFVLLTIVFFAGAMKSISKDGTIFLGNKNYKKTSNISESITETAFLVTETGKIALEIADTESKRIRGLSGRERLADGVGMLFIFPISGIYSFWMKDMNFPIDIIWLDETFKIVHIEANVEPNTFPKSFAPTLPSRYVVELNAGVASFKNLVVGQSLVIENLP